MTTVETADADAELDTADAGVVLRPSKHRRWRRLAWVLAVVVVLLGLHTWVVEPVRLSSASMAPTLRTGDELIIDKLTYRWRGPRRGEIVTASDPQTSGWIIKRVVAVGGDSVGIEDGLLIRNGQPVDEPYVDRTNMGGVYFGPVDVPNGYVFLLGDNRSMSIDSRTYGPVSISRVTGRLVVSW